ncbi:unnamed protein product [Lathyrus sativus]|nr:unnamed protein product [Lathyrus sativus]
MFVLWHKLKRLKHDLRSFSKPLSDVKQRLLFARDNLKKAQQELSANRMNIIIIRKVKELTEEVISLNELEEKILQQRSKIEWLRKGDGNNLYFYASIKAKQHSNCLSNLKKNDGTSIQS